MMGWKEEDAAPTELGAINRDRVLQRCRSWRSYSLASDNDLLNEQSRSLSPSPNENQHQHRQRDADDAEVILHAPILQS